MSCGVYALKVSGTDKVYVGSSVNIQRRYDNHIRALEDGSHHSHKLQSYFNKHHPSVEVVILEKCIETSLPERELYYIEKFSSRKRGFNVSASTSRTYMRYRVQELVEKLKIAATKLPPKGSEDCLKLSFKNFETRARKIDDSLSRILNICSRFPDFAKINDTNVGVKRIHAGFPKDLNVPLSSWVLYDKMMTYDSYSPEHDIHWLVEKALTLEVV